MSPQEHRSRPLASLKDPETFGPPPKRVNSQNTTDADHSGLGGTKLGASLDEETFGTKQEEEKRDVETARRKAAAPPIPFRADRTGISTGHLPKPPVRRIQMEMLDVKSKPPTPPRLPPRQSSAISDGTVSPPPAYSPTPNEAQISRDPANQETMNRLGSAGIDVPGFGIGNKSGTTSTFLNQRNPTTNSRNLHSLEEQDAHSKDLPSKLSRISLGAPQAEAPAKGTSFAEKQSALRTASQFQKDPSSVSFSDAKAAVSTANNFRERHGDQAAAGWKTSTALNNKYNITGKLNSLTSKENDAVEGGHQPVSEMSETSGGSLLPSKKKPPPPPPKKSFATNISAPSPPPVPLSSKPLS